MKKVVSNNLDNLVRIGQLKVEPADQAEFDGILRSAKLRLKDSQIEALSDDSRFSLAYGAAHALALAAIRWHGYRSENRYLVFQCLQHTVGLENAKWRVWDRRPMPRSMAIFLPWRLLNLRQSLRSPP